jgi:methyl-accepting chemotaxis protein
MRFSDIPLVFKVGFPPAFALVMLSAVAAMAVWSGHGQAKVLSTVISNDTVQSGLAADSEQIAAANGALYTLMTKQAAGGTAAASQTALNGVLQQIDTVRSDLVKLRPELPADQLASFDHVMKDLSDYRGGVNVVGSMLGIDFPTAADFIAPFQVIYAQMTSTLGGISQNMLLDSNRNAQQSTRRAQLIGNVLLVFAAGTLLIVALVAGGIILAVRHTVTEISGATEKLASGSVDIDLDRLARGDEFGAIVRSLNVFRENQTRITALRAEQETMQSQQAALAAEQQWQREIKQEEQKAVVEGLASGLSKLALGDMVFRLNTPFASEYEQLRGDFNKSTSRLQEAMRAIALNTQGVRSGVEEITQASDDLSRRTEQQAANLEQTAAALNEITTTVQKTAAGAGAARGIAESARSNAERSGALMEVTVAAINDIQASSMQISSIVGVIDEIAFQTNLLALNAGVEAARAGDAGRGFAVVATEVRALAQRSAQAAKEIKALIFTSNNQVGNGVKSVGETSAALAQIVGQVAEINRLVAEIAALAATQATGLNEVNSAVTQMDQVTQKNAAMVEESTAASHTLEHEAAELARLVAQFQIDEETPRHVAARPGPPPVPPQRRPSVGAAKPRHVAPTTSAHPKDKNWDEF